MESRHHISIKKYQKLSKPESGFFHNMNRMELQIAIQKYACCQIVVLYKVLFQKKNLCFRHLNNLFNKNFWCFSGEKNVGSHFFITQTIGHMKGLKFDADIRRMRWHNEAVDTSIRRVISTMSVLWRRGR